MITNDAEAQILDNIVEDLTSDGYEVFVNPQSVLLPGFMKSYRPDAVAFRRDKNLAIEIENKSKQSKTKVEHLRALFNAPEARDWALQVHHFRSERPLSTLGPVRIPEIEAALSEIEALLSESEKRPALLMAWATLEAMGRVLEPQRISRPQTPRRLVEMLASNGHVTPTEADTLRKFIDRRNSLIHGDLNIQIGLDELHDFLSVLKILNELLKIPENA